MPITCEWEYGGHGVIVYDPRQDAADPGQELAAHQNGLAAHAVEDLPL